MFSIGKSLVLATIILGSTVTLAPKPANAQIGQAVQFGQELWNRCAMNPTGCASVLQWPVTQIVVPQEIRGRNFWEQRQYEQEEMRRRQQEDYNNGRFQNGRGSYGGW